MAVVNGVKKELPIIGFKRSRSSQIHRTTLASVESLTMPLVSILFLSLSLMSDVGVVLVYASLS